MNANRNMMQDPLASLAYRVRSAEHAAIQTVTEAGLEIFDFSDEDRAKMREDAKPVFTLPGF